MMVTMCASVNSACAEVVVESNVCRMGANRLMIIITCMRTSKHVQPIYTIDVTITCMH